MRRIIVLATLYLIIVSCSYFANKKYHIGQPFNFREKSDFINHLQSKKIFDLSQCLYLDSICYFKFVYNQLNNPSVIVLGSFLNDSISIRQSQYYTTNSSCAGRIENEILNNLSLLSFPDSVLDKKSRLSDYNFKKLSTKEDFHLDAEANKVNIFVLYSYSYGNYYDKLYQNIQSLITHYSYTAKIFVVCTDPVYRLK